MTVLDKPLALTHGWADDWWCITDERGARIAGADIEGTGEEMGAIADAIDARSRVSFKRCAVLCQQDRDEVDLWSPRNSINHVTVPLARAKALAVAIRAALEAA